MTQMIFRRKSLNRIASPDQLDRYLQVSTPSLRLILLALFLILGAASVWCFWGSIPVTVFGTGIQLETEAVCFIAADEAYMLEPGMTARLTASGADEALSGRLLYVDEPVPAEQAAEAVGAAWLAQSMPADWVCVVPVELEGAPARTGAVFSAGVILKRQRPIDLLFGG
ncbi:hypothetical protein D3Z39_04450 [Anaerotruncus colihominis]|uniref:NHLM bacteriocin system secretion protein n=1 Tax=Anaerotruncus colihominis TaxID=169435 RepID=A0A845REA0_9FIRM|nr:hypothetical protein [Anaerotruncus colihominis]NBI78124.1 hypothetical protein [Anaerotruncus colihominis]